MQGDELPFPPVALVCLFLVFFLTLWVAVAGIAASLGWGRVVSAYPAGSDPPLSARRVRFGSLRFGGPRMFSPNYGSCINAWLSQAGPWLRPTAPFRLFHPMIFVPWARVQSVEDERVFLFRRVRMKLRDDVPDLLFFGRLGRDVLEFHTSLGPRP